MSQPWRRYHTGVRAGYQPSDRPAVLRGPGERLPEWGCTCRRPDGQLLRRNDQHGDPWLCLLPGDVLAFWKYHPEIKSEANARRMLWLAMHFGRD